MARFSAVARRLNEIAVKHYLPTIRDASGQIPLQNNMVFPISGNPEWDHYQKSVKVDHIINERHKLSGSYNNKYAPRLILDAGGLWDTNELYGGPLAKARRRPDYGWFARSAHDWTVGPRLLNNLTLSFNRRGNPEKVLEADNRSRTRPGHQGTDELRISGGELGRRPDHRAGAARLPELQLPRRQRVGLSDTVSFSRGRHFLKIGMDIRYNQQNRRQLPASSFNFAARATAIPNEAISGTQTGYAFASYLLGIVDSASLSDPVGLGGRRRYYAAFIQDDFKVSSRLTLNLGLRWNLQPPVFETADRLSSWNPAKTDPISGLPGAYDFRGRLPRVHGTAATSERRAGPISDRGSASHGACATLRSCAGAYGIIYEGDSPNGYNAIPLGKPTSVAWGGTYQLASNPVTPWTGMFNWDQGFPNDNFVPGSFDPSWGNFSRPGMIDPSYGKTPYIQQWNLNVQRELPSRFVLDLGYVGNKGTRLRNGDLVRLNQLQPALLDAVRHPV